MRTVARGVRLVALVPLEEGAVGRAGEASEAWRATVAVPKHLLLELIEAENYAREIRVIAR